MIATLLLLGACRGEPQPAPPPPFVWQDTATYTSWDTVPSFATGQVPRNVLMISIDTLRRDHVGRYDGSDRTPTLDELMATGVVLDDHLQCSNWTFASTTCTLMGRHNEENGFMPRLARTPKPVPASTEFLAGWLQPLGFHSILVSPNQWLGPMSGNANGFSEAVRPEGDLSATGIWDQAAERLQAALGTGVDRWYLHVHVLEPHAPYAPPAGYLGGLDALPPSPWDLTNFDTHYDTTDLYPTMSSANQSLLEDHLRVRYDGDVRWLDDQLRTILDDARARGWLDDALVVIWSDHGEAFWEHGQQSHAHTLHAEENDAIAVLWSDDIEPVAWDGPTSSTDLVPTLLHLYGAEMPETVTGLPVGAARVNRTRFAAVNGRDGVEQTAVQGNYKLRYHWSGTVQMFDRRADPQEQTDVWDPTDPDKFALWEALQPRIDALEPLVAERPTTPPGLP